MKRTTGTRAAAIAATLLAAGIVTAGPASAVEAHSSSARITSQAQLHASIMKAAAHENEVCSAGLSDETMGGRPPVTPIGQ